MTFKVKNYRNKKYQHDLKLDNATLNKLKDDEYSSVIVETRTYHLSLHPYHLTNINDSIKEILNTQFAKYNNILNGILLGYQNVKVLNQEASINEDSCFIHINIEADFFIFKPKENDILNGVVNKKSQDHVGCLVHNLFNVSLPKPPDEDEWLGNDVQMEQEIQLKVTIAQLESKLPYIRGQIINVVSEDSGISTSDETIHKTKTKKVKNDKTKKEIKKEVSMEGVEEEGLQPIDSKLKKKKVKKRKHIKDVEEGIVELVEDSKSKKKKVKKDKSAKSVENITQLVEKSKPKKKKVKKDECAKYLEENVTELVEEGKLKKIKAEKIIKIEGIKEDETVKAKKKKDQIPLKKLKEEFKGTIKNLANGVENDEINKILNDLNLNEYKIKKKAKKRKPIISDESIIDINLEELFSSTKNEVKTKLKDKSPKKGKRDSTSSHIDLTEEKCVSKNIENLENSIAQSNKKPKDKSPKKSKRNSTSNHIDLTEEKCVSNIENSITHSNKKANDKSPKKGKRSSTSNHIDLTDCEKKHVSKKIENLENSTTNSNKIVCEDKEKIKKKRKLSINEDNLKSKKRKVQ